MSQPRVRTVERIPGWGWAARCPFSGLDIPEPGFVWRTRSSAKCAVDEARMFGRNEQWEARQRAALANTADRGQEEKGK